ncbi:DUF5397 domain-containing protein [Kerstersia gyiorum]|uniref:DUF5397 domain-containing protein n=1 Tax=Kerstersia gyiorum TaxID=206506 RepID=UPI00214F9E65|nr:DUF5397 domain-containing protein [Kerstersia gyiorum]MCR4158012.1 DUF5397 domain-containing protein [Kerstersia gyiorum]
MSSKSEQKIGKDADLASPSVPVGEIKSFGPFGPKYEVGKALRQLEEGEWLVEITLVETGEKTEYRLSSLLEDPAAK